MELYARTSSIHATSTDFDMSCMAQAMHDGLNQAEHERDSLQEQLTETVERHSDLLVENRQLHKRIAALQQQMTFSAEAQTRLETEFCAKEQELEQVSKTVAQLVRDKKDMAKQLQSEQEAMECQQQRWLQREEALGKQIRKLSSQATTTAATCKRRSPAATADSRNTSPSQPRQRITSPSTERTMAELKSQLANQQARLEKQLAEQLQYQSARINHLEEQLASARQVNQSLMEDNESYQLLLHEKTMNGEILAVSRTAIEADHMNTTAANLADELGNANHAQEQESSLYDEIRSLKDTNRALQLYLNKILIKVIDTEGMQHVLSIDDAPHPSSTSKQHAVVAQPQPPASLPQKTMRSSFSAGFLNRILLKRPQTPGSTDHPRNATDSSLSAWPLNSVADSDNLKRIPCMR